mmetsp:Transcript_16560/g.28968  ORF Transcript_16560/g.28968 Transcript_16560/m.28968 type:complete len:230 (-) Transcript_16560:180-869(-)|eukprot:CAMPEP_0197649812 /NCGR_PEP_ID=MMETSP1338-20131121/29842_1 /TAXON_ID=43686 ORGANISM="Pelagodinium beii, Strain RCC1491" /NCGR_SAMPLE_ID=MMETSP1338 /ASSEMBLY_ACC=CAM_ASM_000754 /LENGTH=229 /DNA_ID=CAMNT_0043224089 /DNA_START=123 /DNA_END=812 /DNA_ORIENTATION=+
MTASRRRDAHDSWSSKAKRWEEKPSPMKETEEKYWSNGPVNSPSTSEEKKAAAALKDLNPTRSRWADIEVEDTNGPEEDWGEGDEGARGNGVTGRRQLGPRGGRRPKFSAEKTPVAAPAKTAAAAAPQEPAKPAPVQTPQQPPQKQQSKPQAQSQSWNSWGNQDWSGGYESWGNQDWEPPSRADMDDCWRRGPGEKPKPQSDRWEDDAWGSCRQGRRWNDKSAVGSGKW